MLGEMGGLSVMMNETFNCGSKLLKVACSTPRRGIGLDAKKGVELRASGWDTWSDRVKVEKGSERWGEQKIQANPKSPGKHKSSDRIRCQA